MPSASPGGTQILMREERSGDTDRQTYGLSYRLSMAAATGFLLKNVHLKGKNCLNLFSIASTFTYEQSKNISPYPSYFSKGNIGLPVSLMQKNVKKKK